jgi:cyclopropane fatty-acyl-phospholipid synthase-like methyltransferase
VELLALRPTDQVLEIGCGPGHAVSLVCAQLTRGTITAIDRSTVQVARARDRNRECLAAGRARIERVVLADLDVSRRPFDKIFAVNVNAFWTTPAPTIASVRRLLRRRGAVYLVYEPPSVARLRELSHRLPQLFCEHAFEVEDVRVQAFSASQGLCVIGRPA